MSFDDELVLFAKMAKALSESDEAQLLEILDTLERLAGL